MRPELKVNVLARLKRVAGQVSGIQRMVEAERDTVEVVRQLTAAQAALMEVGRVLLAESLEGGIEGALQQRDAAVRRRRIGDLTAVLLRFARFGDSG
jgi:DNA-binding FrmR family transcriptional regulator